MLINQNESKRASRKHAVIKWDAGKKMFTVRCLGGAGVGKVVSVRNVLSAVVASGSLRDGSPIETPRAIFALCVPVGTVFL